MSLGGEIERGNFGRMLRRAEQPEFWLKKANGMMPLKPRFSSTLLELKGRGSHEALDVADNNYCAGGVCRS